ncbi:MAG: O-linked N-acetylglucosamine transferase family protein, partial [Planctomycetota bacterium]
MTGWKPVAGELYNRVDIALDTYPYTGCLTTLEAMWMGVPVITLVGDRSAYFLSRAGASMLTRIGLESLAVSSPAEYVAMASALSHDLNALAAMRSSMRQRIATSTLCDAKAYARAVEAAYRKMWHRWCENQNAHTSDNQDANSPKSEQIDRSSAPTTSCPGTDCLKSLTLSD